MATPLRLRLHSVHTLSFDSKMIDTLCRCILAFEQGGLDCQRAEDRPTTASYLSHLAPFLAAVRQEEDLSERISQFERILGHSWLLDPAPFQEALELWSDFKIRYRRD